MTSSGSGGGGASLETSADSSYHHPLNFSFSNSTTTSNNNNNNQFMTSSFSDLLTSGNDIYTGGINSSYQNIDNIVNRFTDRLPSDRIGGGSGNGIPKFKSITPPSLPISPPSVSPSSYFSIPPGLSPAQLLDSPVLLSASNILPSPTTGTYSAHQSYNWRGNSGDFQQQNIKQEDRNYSDFSFQPQPRPLVSIFHQEQQQPWTISQESTTTIGTDFSSSGGNPNVKSEFPRVLHSFSPEISTIQQQANNNQISNNQQQSDYNHPYNSQASQTLREKRRSEDGYNWRKYGQKQVKGSQNPRSYYKCTYPNCPTKKKVERSLDGHITEIVYKGTHNHPKPQSTRRSSSGNNSTQAAAAALASSAVAIPTSSDISDHHLKITTNQMEHVTTPENSSVSIGDEEFDQSSQRSKSGGDEFDEDEKDPKRWKGEIDQNEGTSAVGSRTVREPRVVVQTTSDIDILDDGYRWRKYGQKVVKGNPNPRSYYKCTSSGCAVRKHVERASHDLRAVITTYEGKHNHDVPAARGSGSINRPALPTTLDNNNRHVTMNSTVVRPYPSSVSSIQSNNGNGNVRQPVSEGQTPFTLEMLRSPGSFGFSGFNNPLESSFMNQQQQSENVYSKTKEEPREDMLLESILY